MIQLAMAHYGANIFRWFAIGFAVVASAFAFQCHGETKGAAKQAEKTGKATINAITKGNAGASRSGPSTPGGMLDPYTKN
jgi:hypothetical protein